MPVDMMQAPRAEFQFWTGAPFPGCIMHPMADSVRFYELIKYTDAADSNAFSATMG